MCCRIALKTAPMGSFEASLLLSVVFPSILRDSFSYAAIPTYDKICGETTWGKPVLRVLPPLL
jgi:cytochrome c oxidase assembly protein Cox11